jgi:outer membrane protein
MNRIVQLVLCGIIALAGRAAAQSDSAMLSLSDAVRLGAKQSAPVLVAKLRAAEASARLTQRRADLLPSISGTATKSGHTLNSATFGLDFPTAPGQKPFLDPRGEIIGPINLIDFRASATFAAFEPAAYVRVNAARMAVRAANTEATGAAEQGASLAGTAYVRAVRAAAIVQARAKDSALGDSLLQIAHAQLRAGVGIGLDVTRAQAQVALNHSQTIAALGDAERARLELLRAIGAPLDSSIRLETFESMRTESLPSESDAVAMALRRRPDLLAADQSIAAAKLGLRAIRAERLPSIAAFGDDGSIGKTTSRLLNTYSWGVQLSLPFFDGGRRSGRIGEQAAVTSELEVRRHDLERQISVEVRSAIVSMRSALQLVDAANERLRLAQQEYSQAQDRFRAGVSGNADVITAGLSLTSSRNFLIDALAAYQTARIELARALGTASEIN